MNKESPQVKLLMQRSKEQLIALAQTFVIDSSGTKLELAIEIANYQVKKEEKTWRMIMGIL